MAYDQRNFNEPQSSGGISLPVVIIVALLTGLGGFLAGYMMKGEAEPDPREIVRTLNEEDTEPEDTVVVETLRDTTAPSRVQKVNMDSVRLKQRMKK